MTKDEALRTALKKAYNLGQIYWQQADSEYTSQHRKADLTEAKFKELLEITVAALEAKDEPFGYFRYDLRLDAWVQSRDSNQGAAFYTTPPQRTWVGLTKEERHEISMANRPYCADIMAAHEEELKRRNT